MTTREAATQLDDRLGESNGNWLNSWIRNEAMEAAGTDNTWKQFMSVTAWALAGDEIAYAHSRVDVLGQSGQIDLHVFTATRLVRVSITKDDPHALPEILPLHALEAVRVLRAPTIFDSNRGILIPQIMRLELRFRGGLITVIDNEQTHTQHRNALSEYFPVLLGNLDRVRDA